MTGLYRQRRVHQYVFPEWDHENDRMGSASACGAWDGVQQLVAEQRQHVTCPDCLAVENGPHEVPNA